MTMYEGEWHCRNCKQRVQRGRAEGVVGRYPSTNQYKIDLKHMSEAAARERQKIRQDEGKAKRYQKNKAELQKRQREYYAANKGPILEKQHERYEANKGPILEKQREYWRKKKAKKRARMDSESE